MIDVDKKIILYSTEKLIRYPNDILLIKYGEETIGSIQLKQDEDLWVKAMNYLNQSKIEST